MSSLLEIAGFVAITVAAYEWSGKALALFVGGVLLWFIAQGLDQVTLRPPLKTRLRWAKNAAVRLVVRREPRRQP